MVRRMEIRTRTSLLESDGHILFQTARCRKGHSRQVSIANADLVAPQNDSSSSSGGDDDLKRRRDSIPGRPNLLKLGTVLQNRYRILDILGIGGMSTVYKARDLRFTTVDRACAIKEMFNSADEPKLRQLRLSNFQREAAILATMTHSAVPRIYDYFEQQGTIYLVLELIHGNDLETILSQRGEPFDEAQILEWGISLCSVLAYLHNQQPEPIIFRDLKPSNIMIRAEDQAMMLVDFGIARSFAPQQKGTMIGTEGYAPPEQYKGIADARGDIYALGATLHHLGTGNDPRSETPFTFAQRPPKKLNPMLTEGFEELILKAVNYNADDRYQNVDEVRKELDRLRARGFADRADAVDITAHHVSAIAADRRDRQSGSQLFGSETPASPAVEPPGEPVTVSAPTPVATPAPAIVPVSDRLSWEVKTGDEVRGSASTAGGAIYVGSYDGNLYAIDETDGTVRWKFKAQRGIVSRPVPVAEMVIVGSEDKSLYAIARLNGRVIWSFRTNMQIRSSPIADERAVVVGSDDGFLYRLDRLRGVVTWRYKTWGPIRSTPVQVNDAIIFGSDDGYLYNVHAESGNLTWRNQVGSPIVSSPSVTGSTIVVGASDGAVRGFSLKEGKQIWSVTTAKTVISSPAIADEIAYVGSADGHVYAIHTLNGELIWKSQICRQITSSPTVDGKQLYVGGNDAIFYSLNLEDGSERWRFGTGGAIVTRPLVTDEHIVFGSLDGSVYALKR